MGLTVALESDCANRKCLPRLKIAAVIPSMGPGGAERVMSVLANGWCEAGHEVCLVSLAGADVPDFYPISEGVARERLGVLQTSSNPARALANNFGRFRKLRATLRRRRPDVVVSFMTETNVLAIMSSVGTAIPVVAAERVSPEDHPLPRPWNLARRLVYSRAASVVMLTERSAQWLRKNVPGANACVIANPVSSPPNDEADVVARKILAFCAESAFVFALGRLERQKGFDLLLKAFASASEAAQNWRLVIAGEGRERASLEALVRDLGLSDRVLLPGVTTTPRAVMESAGFFVLSSRYEGFPNALTEAMACGLACISFDCRTGPSEMITDGVNGILLPAGDVDALSRAIVKLMADSEFRAALGRNARAAERRYALPSVLGKWDDLFRDLTQAAACNT